MGEHTVFTGDCLAVMATLDGERFDAIVTDPPYGLGFMGKDWDHGVPGVQFWTEALRVAKPGAFLVAFGGTRTHHRLTCAIEDAGWEVRDCLMWLYGSGFPKSHNVSKAIDKAAGMAGTYGAPKSAAHAGWIERGAMRGEHGHEGHQRPWMDDPAAVERNARQYLPGSDAAKQWDGWGTALKPAWEPIILARKPLIGTVAANVQAHGTGGLNIEGCRIGGVVDLNAGRWPANVVLDEDAGAILGDKARFFYCAKASRSEREAMEGGPGGLRDVGSLNMRTDAHAHRTGNATRRARNHHPTVKPLALMRWLVRLVTPPGGEVLDPFAGSGSTLCAAKQEGMRGVGIELSEEYAEIANARLCATPSPGRN
jgi:site-specific DNA-methyltransferase (adenine-specific)